MLEKTQPARRVARRHPPAPARAGGRSRLACCCTLPLSLLAVLLLYFFAPLRTNVLLMGTDDSPERGGVGRTDTIILMTIVPLRPYVGMLSIPRDLWVHVPGIGEQRINTAYFFAESSQAGSGGPAAAQTVSENFGVPVRYYAVIRMLGLARVVDALGGVDITLGSTLGGLAPGAYHLNGEQALAFVRERSSGDDFSRMVRAQTLLAAILTKALLPEGWSSLPELTRALSQVIDTNIPFWQWPRLLFALLRAFVFGIDSQTVAREMVVPFQTSQGAQVLAPNWDLIRPLLDRMFGG